MKRWTLLFGAALAITCSAMAAERGAQGVDDAWCAAMKANDVERVVALYAQDAVMYPPDQKEARGSQAIRALYAGLLGANTVQDARIVESHGRTLRDFSVSWGHASLTLAPKAGGSPATLEVRFTAVAVRRNGQWLYLVDHASAPLPPPPK